MTFKEIKEKLRGLCMVRATDRGYDPEDYDRDDYTVYVLDDELSDYKAKKKGIHPVLGEINKVVSDEKYEGKQYLDVYYFKDHEVYMGITGEYSSYDDENLYWSNVIEVFPTIVSKVEYHAKAKSSK